MSNSEDVVPKILEKIHGEIRSLRKDTNERFRELHQEVGDLRENTTRRLDLLAEGSTRTNTQLVELNGRVEKLDGRVETLNGRVESLNDKVEKLDRTVERNGQRFEHALITQGASHRELEDRVARLEAHVGIEP